MQTKNRASNNRLILNKSAQSGQILLIVVLSMVVALSVGLSIASRTISNLKISKQNEESQRAFQAAEAGVERAVRQVSTEGSTVSGGFVGNLTNSSNFDVDLNPVQADSIDLNGGDKVERAVGIDVWLSTYPDYDPPFYNGRVNLYWGQPGQECNGTGDNYSPAIEVLLIYDRDNPKLLREVFDPCEIPERIPGAANVSSVPAVAVLPGTGTQYRYSATFPKAGDPAMSNALLFKVIPIFNSTRIGVEKATIGQTIPSQGAEIISTGKSGDTVRKIRYYQSYPQIPNELFPYAIVSQNNTP